MRWVPRGLKPRLMAAFLLLTVLGAAGAAGASYATARTLLLEDAQDGFMNPLVDDVRDYALSLTVPPAQQDLDDFATYLRGKGVVLYEGMRSRGGPDPSFIPEEMRAALKNSVTVLWQRRDDMAEPYVVIGIPLLRGDGTRTGVEVWAVTGLGSTESAINSFATAAWVGVSLVLPLALGLALLTARGVLRPVRRLGAAARALGSGRLDTRVDDRGSDELADLARTFNSAAEQLEASQAASRRFVSDVSHELRTPLTAMSAVTAVLDEDAETLPPDTAVAARLVSAETRKLTRLVNDLMEISRFDEGGNVLELDEWDIGTAVRDTLAARGWAESVEAVLPEGIDGVVDRRRLDVIVANLVGNALKHGGAPVRVEVRPGGVIEVSDHGPGIPAEALPHIFDRFYKADTARSRSEGSGLGLAIAWENARLHGGTIDAANGPSGGAVFTLRLPW
ncbi:two-component system, OmpR family, sensor histidine kinase MtrB [Lentzea fradiae]|uniref:histidine kinase n=1 Tax=Lentzea fradiae TaxID=200378 RepID=A0A1G7RPV1_9PSEU|nr:HAMP domain-containing sensor histidine kinase [Lentzea fradiae]SDG12219.1 two-component system, OmpR family, sensor histidine kinase MtrB [Lentzea fradiae]